MRVTVGGVLVIAAVAGATVYFAMDTTRMGTAFEKIHGAVNGAMSLVGLYKSGESVKEPYSPPPPFPGSSTGTVNQANAGVSTTTALPVSESSSTFTPAVSAEPTLAPVATPTPVAKKTRAKKKGKRRRRVATTATAAAASGEATPAAPTPKKRSRRSTKKVSASPSGTAAVKTAPAKQDPLMGNYVSLQLITGRSVQGILEGKTATHYVLNVPGLGPLEYPIENVKSVTPVQ